MNSRSRPPQRQSVGHPLCSLTDLELLELVLDAQELAWKELLRRFRNLIYRCIHKVVGKFSGVLGSETVNDIFSEVCLNLLRDDMRKLRAYDPSHATKLSSWIGLITINTAHDHLRRCARQPWLDQIDGCPERSDPSPSPLDELLRRDAWRELGRTLHQLSPGDRRFMELYLGLGLSAEQIARHLRISVKSVYSRKNKVKQRLIALARAPVSQKSGPDGHGVASRPTRGYRGALTSG